MLLHRAYIPAVYLLVLIALSTCAGVSSRDENNAALSTVEQPNSDALSSSDDAVIEEEEGAAVTQEVFYPTNQWQEIKPGQAIPKGLHVRMNMETGINEAKLMEEDVKGMMYWNKDGRQGMLNTKSKAFSKDELKQALKKFKTETFTDKASLEHAEKVKKQFRSYETLREELRRMELDVRTDGEIVTDLVGALRGGGLGGDETANVLRSLEYYLHQIDNAVLFSDLGGMAVIRASLNSSNADLRKEAASVLGVAVQSNPKVQINAMEHGLLAILIRRLSLDPSKDLRKAYMFALSSLMRHFPHAQAQFLQLGGLSVLSTLFNEGESRALRVKTVTLLHDLLLEKEYAMASNDTSQQAKKEQYYDLPLAESLLHHGWCDRIPTLLASSAHDTNEKTLHAMTDIVKHCAMNFASFAPTLLTLREEYAALAHQESLNDPSDATYFAGFMRLIDDILRKLPAKDEL